MGVKYKSGSTNTISSSNSSSSRAYQNGSNINSSDVKI